MSAGYVISVDPSELANRFAAPAPYFDDMDSFGESDLEPILASMHYETEIKPLLDRIPEREADLIEMYYIDHKRQADIAIIFGVTQAAISYRLDRGVQRVRFLLSIPQVLEEDMRRDLLEVPLKSIDVDILVGMWQTTCQSEVAARLGLTQGRVRHRFFGAVKTLDRRSQEDDRYAPYAKVFNSIAGKKFNILREVRLPQWANRGGDAIT
jgi:DNA-directed RNA polymerase specialized sigma24 family protein